MNLTEAIARVRQGLGFRDYLESEIIAVLGEAQGEFEQGQSLTRVLLEEEQTFSITAGDQSVAFPTRFLRLYEDDLPNYVNSDGTRTYLAKRPFDEGQKYYQDYSAGAPLGFAQRKDSFHVWPVPDVDYSLTWSYYKGASTLADGGDTNTWLTYYPYRLIGRAGQILAADLRDQSSQAVFDRMYAVWTGVQKADEAAQDDAGMPRAMGRNK